MNRIERYKDLREQIKKEADELKSLWEKRDIIYHYEQRISEINEIERRINEGTH